MSATSLDPRLIVALDVETISEARRLVEALDGAVSFFKLGYWLLFQPGTSDFIEQLILDGRDVFLDYKLHDIGETMRHGAASIAHHGAGVGAKFLTAHGDRSSLRAAVEGTAGTSTGILAITVLTSVDDAALKSTGIAMGMRDVVALRVHEAAKAGCSGVIASGADNLREIRAIAARNFVIVTPGIRLPGDDPGDQRRTTTPRDAIAKGADYIVVGRPITRARNAREAAYRVIEDMGAA